uniref:ribosomal protein L4 n=1 Tax=Gloiopeltis furcata TaxID=42017 RepID=UPI0028D737CB|nr:ribosomal protein L4 [Gloiopeltis furcata]WMP13924.1 ribosomal protein L4 [Gloiopeltis furcata]
MINEQQLTYSIEASNQEIKGNKTIRLKVKNYKGVYIVHRAITQQLSNNRQRTANTKTRSEVSGGGKKPWKQKGTGRARAGSIRSPLWRGGGVVFGPESGQRVTKINKKEKQLALRTLLYNKFKHTIVVQDEWQRFSKPSTKLMSKKISEISGITITKTNVAVLIIVTNKNSNLYLSVRNLKNVDIIRADQLNTFSLLKAQKLIITTSSLDKITEVYSA